MFKVKVLTTGKCKESWLQEALREYEKRLQGTMEISWQLSENFEAALLKEPSFIALDLQGKLLTSEEVAKKLFSEWGSRICFAIGGAEGFSREILTKASFRWSLSPLTFTHQITRLLLVEQLYRAMEIEKGSSYHK